MIRERMGEMVSKHLAGVLDGGPHEDPREAEDEALLNDGEDEEAGTGVHNDDEEWDEEEFSEAGKAEKFGKGAKPQPKAEDEEEEKEEAEEKKPVKKEEKAEEKEEEAEEEKEEQPPKDEETHEERESDDPKTKYKTIPYSRFKKELTKRKELALRAVQAEERAKAVEDRLSRFEQAAQKASDPEPDRSVDPLAHQDWRIRQLERSVVDKSKTAQPQPRSDALQRFLHQQYIESAQEFKADHADFDEAYEFTLRKTAENVIRQYPEATQEQVGQYIRTLEMNEAYAALNAGRDPAERVYEIAQGLGWTGKAAAGEPSSKRSRVDDAVKEEALKAKSKSLAGKGTTGVKKDLTIDDTEDMSNEELLRFMDGNSGRKNPLKP